MDLNEHTDALFENHEFEGESAARGHFENCIFRRCRFVGSRLTNTRFLGCRFENCDLSLARVAGTTFRDTTLVDCKAVGLIWPEATGLHSVSFERCKLSDGTMAGMDLRRMKFLECGLENVDFQGARLDHSVLRSCRLQGALFHKTSLVEADLTDSQGYAFDARENRLKNTRVSLPDALALLDVLGVKVVP